MASILSMSFRLDPAFIRDMIGKISFGVGRNRFRDAQKTGFRSANGCEKPVLGSPNTGIIGSTNLLNLLNMSIQNQSLAEFYLLPIVSTILTSLDLQSEV